jgi:uncharacterized protein YqjF (DUF2071 family)
MRWHDLLFLHWPIRPQALRALIPAALEIDTYDGWAWLGVVPFHMSGVRPRYMPAWRYTAVFPEINVRTYVKTPGRSGVWFFSLDAMSHLAVRTARLWFGLPYYYAQIQCVPTETSFAYHSTRHHRRAMPAEFVASYRPAGPVFQASRGTLEHWLTERYCLYAVNRRGTVGYGDIHHAPWPLQVADAEVQHNTMTAALGLTLPNMAPVQHFARSLEVVAWSVMRLASETGQ